MLAVAFVIAMFIIIIQLVIIGKLAGDKAFLVEVIESMRLSASKRADENQYLHELLDEKQGDDGEN